jgi:hypothetical protein
MELLENSIIKGGICKNDAIQLTVLDILTRHINTSGVFFFKKSPNLERLKQSLSKALDTRPNFGASMVREGDQFFLYRNNKGVNFSVYNANEMSPNFDVLEPITEGSPLLEPDAPPTNIFDSGKPLTSFRLTLFADDCCALAFQYIHSLADGSAFSDFIHCWSMLYNNKIPAHSCTYSRSDIAKLAVTAGHRSAAKLNIVPRPNFDVTKKLSENKKTFGAVRIEIPNVVMHSIVTQCKENSDLPITSSDVIHALVWQAFTHSNNIGRSELSKIYTIFDIRKVGGLDIPHNYEGNAMSERGAKAVSERIKKLKLHELAALYHKQVKPVTETEIRNEISYLSRKFLHGNFKESGYFSNFLRSSFVDCLEGTGIYVNDMRFLKTTDVIFEDQTIWCDFVTYLGLTFVAVYQANNYTISFRYFGHRDTLPKFSECLESTVFDLV